MCSSVYIAFSVEEMRVGVGESFKLQCLKDAETAGQFSRFLDSGVYIQLKGSITRFRLGTTVR